MSKRDDLFDVDPPEEVSTAEEKGEDFFFEMNEENSDNTDSQPAFDADDDSVSYEETPVKEKGGSRQRIFLLLLLVLLLIGAGYFYLGDILLAPEPAATPQVVKSQPQKQKIPERKAIVREQPAVKEVVMPSGDVAGTPVEKTAEAQAQEPSVPAPVEPVKENQVQAEVAPKAEEKSVEDQTVATAAPAEPVKAEEEKAATKPAAATSDAPYVLQIGAYVLESNLERTLEQVRSFGYEPFVIDGKKTVTMTRLRVGAYPEKVAREKLSELQKLSPSAFLLLEGDQMALYAGSYYGLDRGRSHADLLYQHGIHLDEETVEVAIPMKIVRFGTFTDAKAAEGIAKNAQKAGLDAMVIKQG